MSSTRDQLTEVFRAEYGAEKLGPDGFERVRDYIESRIGTVDAAGEGFGDPARQRRWSTVYNWGHDHVFSDEYAVAGKMTSRHVNMLANYIDEFDMPVDMTGMRVLDVGVWTGGTSLLMAALGAEVVATEEVRKYADTVNFLADAFGVADRVRCYPLSLYDLLPRFADAFDFIHYSGVIYHVTDPILSLRLCYSALKDSGSVFVETAALDAPGAVCSYEGVEDSYRRVRNDPEASGWCYFLPTPTCLKAWMEDVGLQSVKVSPVNPGARCYGAGTRKGFQEMLQAGLARTDTR